MTHACGHIDELGQRLRPHLAHHPAMLVWMPSNSGAACTPMKSVTIAPQSPPCATYHLVARTRRRRSARSASGTFTWNSRIASLPDGCVTAFIAVLLSERNKPGRASEPAATVVAAVPQ